MAVIERILRLLGFAATAASFVSDAITAARQGKTREALLAMQRASEVQAFKIRHGWSPGKSEAEEILALWERD